MQIKKNKSKPIRWVKKFVKAKDWNQSYSREPTHCFLKKVRGGAIVGFLMVEDGSKIPDDCELMDEEDLEIMQKHRKASNIYPLPFPETSTPTISDATGQET